MKKLFPFSVLFFIVLFSCALLAGDNPEVERGLENFNAFFREVNDGYVDKPDAEVIMRASIDAALRAIDPYSYYISAKEQADKQKAWKGILYGGFGVNIVQRDSEITVTDVSAGYPAALSDIRHGDKILAINNFQLRGLPFDSALKKLRGEPGSAVTLTIKRQNRILEKTVTRAEIRNKAVQCTSVLDNKTGYICFTHFLDGSADELRKSVYQLKEKEGITSLVIDLRGNSGGLVVEAVKAANIFLPKNVNIVTFQGRQAVWNYDNLTFNEALDTILPLVLLTDNNSISAAELFAGAIQDYDRGLIVGRKTFGKGLVQGTHNLPYGNSVYITSARYYTPSGRCIQELDYIHKDATGKATKAPDSLRQMFHTAAGRIVYNIGGIAPDIQVELDKPNTAFVDKLRKADVLGDFANTYRNAHESISGATHFQLTSEDFADFKLALKKSGYPFKTETEDALDALITQATKAQLGSLINAEQKKLKRKLLEDRIAEIDVHRAMICSELAKEICARYYFNEGRIENTLYADADMKVALELLKNPAEYSRHLRP